MTRMFTYEGKRMATWSPFTGCNFNCSYCWARKLAETKLKASYPNGFVPEEHPNRIEKHFKLGSFVFVSSMGDISFSDRLWPDIMSTIEDNPEVKFLLCTKNPAIYIGVDFPDNVYTGATIETNRDITISKAPLPYRRAMDMCMNMNTHKFISIEPVMDFDLNTFVQMILDINPAIVEVGADNYHNNLPEPSSDKVKMLLAELRKFDRVVIEKPGLERLKHEIPTRRLNK